MLRQKRFVPLFMALATFVSRTILPMNPPRKRSQFCTVVPA